MSERARLLRLWPFIVLIGLALVFVLMLTFSRKAPAIASLEPAMAAPGQEIVLTGDYFGRTAREGTLSIAGEIPPPSLVKSWSDQKIVFIVPEDATSGLVSVSNSQGSSPGVLFTNTETIPTVLQGASRPGAPLLTSVPTQPASGQIVTVSGRGFGSGERRAWLRVQAGENGPAIDLLPSDCLLWSDRSIAFRWPAGAGAASSVLVTNEEGSSASVGVNGVSALVYEDPRSLIVEIRATAVSQGPMVIWGVVPQNFAGTTWTFSGTPVSAVFRWNSGGEHRAVYRLALTTWAQRLTAPGGVSAQAPAGDPRPAQWWKPALAALKTLTAKWGLEAPDPWVRIQRIQTGLAAFSLTPGGGPPALVRAPAEILASGRLDSLEVSSLAVVLAGQAGVPARLVTGLWLNDAGVPVPRVWAQVWLSGAGWIPWDAVDGTPGSLDNRHFAFEVSPNPPVRLEPQARLLGPAAPFGQGEAAAEALWTSQEPIVQWEVRRAEK